MFRYFPETKKADLRIKTILNGPSELYDLLKTAQGLGDVGTVVCENYRTRPPENTNPRGRSPYGRSQFGGVISAKDFWSEQLTIRVIGACEMYAQWQGAQFVTQEPKDVLPMGVKWCDFKVPKGHLPDDISAYIHGVHFMRKRNMILGVDDVTKFGQETI
jgi:hypothetical protein